MLHHLNDEVKMQERTMKDKAQSIWSCWTKETEEDEKKHSQSVKFHQTPS